VLLTSTVHVRWEIILTVRNMLQLNINKLC
jgi:hypothetical protein